MGGGAIRSDHGFWDFFLLEISGSVQGPQNCHPIVPFCFRSKVIGSGVKRSKLFFCMGFSMGFFCGPKQRYFFKKVAEHIFDAFFSVSCGTSKILMIFDINTVF
jgi:hypothetical protein